jgi:hypothetical protein
MSVKVEFAAVIVVFIGMLEERVLIFILNLHTIPARNVMMMCITVLATEGLQ